MNDIVKISLVLIAILAVTVWFEVILPRQSENSIKATTLLSEAEFLKGANSGKVNRCSLVVDKKQVSKLQDIAFAKVLKQDRQYMYTTRRGGKHYRYFWVDVDNRPADIVLYTAEHHVPVHLNSKEIDIGFLPVFLKFTNYSWQKQFSSVAGEIALLHEFVPEPDRDLEYVIKGLHPGQAVTVVGLVEKSDGQYHLHSFNVGSDDTNKHPVIVTPFSSADLTEYLETNYLVGKGLVEMVQDNSHYEKEPHL